MQFSFNLSGPRIGDRIYDDYRCLTLLQIVATCSNGRNQRS